MTRAATHLHKPAWLLCFYLAVVWAEDMRTVGTFTDVDQLLDLMRRRQEQLGLSNAALEQICGLAPAAVNKYLGPSREKCPGGFSISLLLDGLCLSGALFADAAKEARYRGQIAAAGRRTEGAVHPPQRISRRLIERVKPYVLAELAREVYEPPRRARSQGRPRKAA